MAEHIDALTLARYVANRQSALQVTRIEEHLADCASCREGLEAARKAADAQRIAAERIVLAHNGKPLADLSLDEIRVLSQGLRAVQQAMIVMGAEHWIVLSDDLLLKLGGAAAALGGTTVGPIDLHKPPIGLADRAPDQPGEEAPHGR